MANIQGFPITNKTPIASHGEGNDEKVMRFQVTLPITANADTIEFGYLPDYAVVTGAEVIHTAVFVGDIGITGDGDGLFDGITTVANVPQRTALSTIMGKNVGMGPVAVTGLATGDGTAGTMNLIVRYVVEEPGVAYPFIAAV